MPTTATPPKPKPRVRKATAPRLAPSAEQSARKARRGAQLPGWSDLDRTGLTGTPGRAAAGQKKAAHLADRKAGRPRLRPFDAVPSLRFGLLVLIACVVGTLFVAHVYATRATLAELQDARRQNEQLRLAGQRLRGEFHQMTGPDAVMPRARALGLEEGIAYGVPIQLDHAND